MGSATAISITEKSSGPLKFGIIGTLSALAIAFAAKHFLIGPSTGGVDPGKFALGRYPLADRILKADFSQLVGSPKTGREYNSFVLFNALDPSAGCQICPMIDESFKGIVSSFPLKQHLEQKVAFATLDLATARDVFVDLKIQTAPWLMFFKAFPAGQAPPEPVSYNIKKPMTPEAIVKFISENLGAKVDVRPPKPFSERLSMFALSVLAIGLAVLTLLGKLSFIIYNPWVAMLLSTAFVISMNSGYMFCRIRNLPLNPFSYATLMTIAPGVQTQSGAEAWLVGSLLLTNSVSAAVLGMAVPKIRNPILKRLTTALFLAAMLFGFKQQLAIFTRKFPSYPFRLFP